MTRLQGVSSRSKRDGRKARVNRRVLLGIMFGAMLMAGGENTVATSAESTPPKPPNCPDLPERRNVSLVESERRCAGELSCLFQKLGKLTDQAAFVYH
jgi:hypothetical protein